MFVHPALADQVIAPQPRLVTVLVGTAGVAYFPGLTACSLMRWPSFWHFAANHNSCYYVTLLLVQLTLAISILTLVWRPYGSALRLRVPINDRQVALALACLMPLFFFHAFHSLRGLDYIANCPADPVDATGRGPLASFYEHEWYSVGSGTSPVAITFTSIITLLGPVFEETMFTGFLMNAVMRRYGLAAALLGVPLCFSLYHIPNVGVNASMAGLALAGLTYSMMRVCSGSLWLPVLGHCTINALIFLPKWVVAAVYLRQL